MSKYIKFAYETRGHGTQIIRFSGFAELRQYRRKLLRLGLIGVDSNGIGFGNLSVRDDATDNFYITGSAIGGVPKLTPVHCAKVVAYDLQRNWLQYEGTAIPSSESLTHAAVYKADPKAGAVIHYHDSNLWAALVNRVPTTSKAVGYGTPQMAYEIVRLFEVTDLRARKILIMGGHKGGVLTFGKNLDEAFAALMRERRQMLTELASKRRSTLR